MFSFSRNAMAQGCSAKAEVGEVVIVTAGANGAAMMSAKVEAETSV